MPLQTSSEQIQKVSSQVQQLHQHLRIDRLRLSKTMSELVKFCRDRESEDPLIHSIKDNPFKEKKSCSIL